MSKLTPKKQIRLFLAPKSAHPDLQQLLESAGYSVDAEPFTGPATLRHVRENPPLLFIIDLTRRPSTGRDIGIAVRHYQATRSIPLIFVGGSMEKVDAIKKLLPDAVYTRADKILPAIKEALANPPPEPIKPASLLAGYSGTPLPRKLGLKANMQINLVNAPANFEQTLGELPQGVILHHHALPKNNLLLWFIKLQHELETQIKTILPSVGKGGIWIIWPKKSSKISSDLNQNVVRQTGLAAGLVDYKICAIDKTWSGLKFAWRKSSESEPTRKIK